MFRLTIIIPYFPDTSTAAFEDTLASVLLYQPIGAEIIVADGVGYDDLWDTNAEGVRFLSMKGRPHPNPVDLLNAAVRRSNGDVVHFLYPGTEVSEHWVDTALDLFADPEIDVVIPCVYDRRKSNRIFSLGVRYGQSGILRTVRRSQLAASLQDTVVPHVSAVFFRKKSVIESGLLDQTHIPQLALVDMALRLLETGGKPLIDMHCRITVRPNFLPATSPFIWGVQVERLYFRWLGRHHSFWSLGSHFCSFFVDFWRHFPRLKAFQLLAGRFCGLFCSFGIGTGYNSSLAPSFIESKQVNESNAVDLSRQNSSLSPEKKAA